MTEQKPEGSATGHTFRIRIYCQQHASWQGAITWLEKEKTIRFRSGLEMLKLMMEATNLSSDQEAEADLWSEPLPQEIEPVTCCE